MSHSVVPIETRPRLRAYERVRAQFNRDRAPLLLLGAGATLPHLPDTAALKRELLRQAALASQDAPPDLDALRASLDQPHLTLEVLCSMLHHRCPNHFNPAIMWSALCAAVPPSPLTSTVAALRETAHVGPIVTTNVDAMCMTSAEHQGQRNHRGFRVITERQTESGHVEPTERDICALHGTVYRLSEGTFAPPLTVTARGLARPLSAGMHRYLTRLFEPDRPVVVLGYSGSDHYDVNPLLRHLLSYDPHALRNWLWVCHQDSEQQHRRVRSFVAEDQIVTGDAAELLREVSRSQGLPPAASTGHPAPEPWQAKFARVMGEFNLPAQGARDFLQDLRRNLPGAWVALEHYRAFGAANDEPETLVFGDLDGHGEHTLQPEHLTYRYGDHDIPFGTLLLGDHTYRTETAEQRRIPPRNTAQSHPQTSALLTDVLHQIRTAVHNTPVSNVRTEDRVLMLVAQAIAEDYLGLIERHRSELTPDQPRLRESAVRRFAECRRLADEAAGLLAEAEPDSGIVDPLDDLVQPHVWALVGQADIARTLPREEAVRAYADVLERHRDVLAHHRKRAADAPYGERAHDQYALAHYPQLWLRAGELLKALLHCEGETDLPRPWDQLADSERDLADMAYRTCMEAYGAYRSLTSGTHRHYPAACESRLIYFASRAEVTEPHEPPETTRHEARSAVDELRHLDMANPELHSTRVDDVFRRFDRIQRTW